METYKPIVVLLFALIISGCGETTISDDDSTPILLSPTTSLSAANSFSRETHWPPISSYDDMQLYELSTEIALMRKDLEFFKKKGDQESRRLAVQAYNRLNLLFQIYAEKSGRPLETVREMYGNPTLY